MYTDVYYELQYPKMLKHGRCWQVRPTKYVRVAFIKNPRRWVNYEVGFQAGETRHRLGALCHARLSKRESMRLTEYNTLGDILLQWMFKIVSIQNASNLSSKQAWSAWNASGRGSYGNTCAYDTTRQAKALFNVIHVQLTKYSGDSVEFKCMEVWKYNGHTRILAVAWLCRQVCGQLWASLHTMS